MEEVQKQIHRLKTVITNEHKFTTQEMLDMSLHAAQLSEKLKELEAEKKSVTDSYKKQIDGKSEMMSFELQRINEGKEWRDFDVEKMINEVEEIFMYFWIDKDTGETTNILITIEPIYPGYQFALELRIYDPVSNAPFEEKDGIVKHRDYVSVVPSNGEEE